VGGVAAPPNSPAFLTCAHVEPVCTRQAGTPQAGWLFGQGVPCSVDANSDYVGAGRPVPDTRRRVGRRWRRPADRDPAGGGPVLRHRGARSVSLAGKCGGPGGA
jgi:hypothetical protein